MLHCFACDFGLHHMRFGFGTKLLKKKWAKKWLHAERKKNVRFDPDIESNFRVRLNGKCLFTSGITIQNSDEIQFDRNVR